MGLRFRKSFKIAPGVRVNVGKTRSSVSIGSKGLTTNISKRGVRTTASIPGTGLSYTTNSQTSKRTSAKRTPRAEDRPANQERGSIIEGVIGLAIISAIGYFILKWIF
ncbi:DUF4236 domain-containing protein [Pseudovibrio brasiliensis]|uniref:DUF4236 domain-containing protein n=1 Tax=Pseudovibrio brasiliensis TaxID=1898042 RepID=A0ABX8AVF1_9HYPH|nr:DUF4236 domain-containing protein [Pseudovibrio brasiliensis]QUS59045.1 DUF4236 domain-containing protein [Pseudovibrio brasiliensis]